MPERDGRRRALALVRALRCVVVGGALAAAGVGVIAGIPALAGVGLVVAVEETLEFAVVARALAIERAPVARLPGTPSLSSPRSE